jgi:copper oxidase (laccase) domain-containing protein
MLQALSISGLTGIRHGFFTRSGGVSHGVYATLNGGVGSNDAPDKVAENRARMATALGVEPDRLLTAYQIHSPSVVIADEPWTQENRPRADAIVTRAPRLAIGVSTADCGPLLLVDAEARVARSPAWSKRRSPPWRGSAPSARVSWQCSALP